MCGIAGILNYEGRPADLRELSAMTMAIAHRGPDGEGFFAEGPVALGHRRLSILDLSPAGAQPMTVCAGRYHITYNGEVYNFLELRRELEAKGHRFFSTSDTEVVGVAYAEWGAGCLDHFNGMWAFAIWDSQDRELFLARDRFGVKPLFYFATDQRFAFASEIKGLLALHDCPRKENLPLVRDFLTGYPPIERGAETVFAGILRLEPGHRMVVHDGRVRDEEWWNTWASRVDVPRKPSDQVERFRELFESACSVRLRSDVPVGTLLSGGMDSSAIACTIARVMGQGDHERTQADWQRTFSLALPGSTFDESDYARSVLRYLGLPDRFITMERPNILEAVRRNVRIQDVPVWPSLLAADAVFGGVAADGVKVTLDGQGADEMLSGYQVQDGMFDYLRRGRFIEAYRSVEGQSRNWMPQRSISSIAVGQVRQYLSERLRLRTRIYEAIGRERPMPSNPFGVPSRALEVMPIAPPVRPSPADAEHVDSRLWREFHETVLPQILRGYDHTAMAHGVESRMPFLDWRLVTYSFSLPVDQKIADGQTKVILRRAMQGRMPDAVLNRRVKFGFPIAVEWFDDPDTQESIRQIVRSDRFGALPYWDAAVFRNWFEQQNSTGWQWHAMERLFQTLSVYIWHEEYFS